MTGFKCGVEIHQRLDTSKLFCNCYHDPAKAKEGESIMLERKLRAVAGELGEVDRAAEFQASLDKTHAYRAPLASSCLVECDDEPPHELNEEALEQALLYAKALKSKFVDEVQVMRKIVLDGSAVSGFQRTSLVALGGKIDSSKGIVGIQAVCIEEESSAIDNGEYRLDRLGIPLIEVATAPDIKDGEHCREVCEKLGLLLRSVAKVQRGIGSIRQDVNVSIKGGARIEIKGVQDLKALSALIENEVQRQESLIKLKKTKVKASPISDWSAEFKDSPCGILKGKKVYGFTADCPGLLKTKLHKGKTLGNELAGYARVNGARGIIHSDEDLKKYGLESFKSGFWVVCAGNARALEAVRERLLTLQKGVPEETRRADGDKTHYLRPLPGGARMYPETDCPPIQLTKERIKSLAEVKGFDERVADYGQLGLGKTLAEKAARSEKTSLFESLANEYDAKLVASLLLEKSVELKREGIDLSGFKEEEWRELLRLHAKEFITKAGMEESLKFLAKEPKEAFKRVLKEKGFKRLSAKEVNALAEKFEGPFGRFMAEHRLNADASDARKAFEKRK